MTCCDSGLGNGAFSLLATVWMDGLAGGNGWKWFGLFCSSSFDQPIFHNRGGVALMVSMAGRKE